MRNALTRLLLTVAIAATTVAPLHAAADQGESAAQVYARAQRVNAGLQSYQADVHVDLKMHSFPPISPALDGTAYFKQPAKTAVIFNTVPFLAQQIKKVYPQIEPVSEWPALYEVSPVSDDGTASVFRLVRKKNGRIDHVDATVDDKTATITTMAYYYKDNGGTITFSQVYDLVDGNYVIKSQTGKVDIPHYNADIASTFSNYKLNVKVDDKVFEE